LVWTHGNIYGKLCSEVRRRWRGGWVCASVKRSDSHVINRKCLGMVGGYRICSPNWRSFLCPVFIFFGWSLCIIRSHCRPQHLCPADFDCMFQDVRLPTSRSKLWHTKRGLSHTCERKVSKRGQGYFGAIAISTHLRCCIYYYLFIKYNYLFLFNQAHNSRTHLFCRSLGP